MMYIYLILTLATMAQARIAVTYAHEKTTDYVAKKCILEMFPNNKRIQIQETDEACIIYCVLKKFGIINSKGIINLDVYKRRLIDAHILDQNIQVVDYGNTCVEVADNALHKHDVCRKAKIFNDCTHLFRVVL